MIKFEVGKKYYDRSLCDWNCIFEIEIIKRTEKMITYNYEGQTRRSKLHISDDGIEYIRPDNYSMAPRFDADKTTI